MVIRSSTLLIVPALLGAALVAGVVGYVSDRTYITAGTPYPGFAAAACYGLLRLVAAVSGSFVLGSLVYTLFCTAPTKEGRVDVDGYAGVHVAERAAIVWALSSLLLIGVSASDGVGSTLPAVLRHGALGQLIGALEKPKAWIVASILTVVIAGFVRLVLSWNGLFALAALSAIAVITPACVGNAGEGPNHDYGTGAVIIFTLALSVVPGLTWCVAQHCRRSGAKFDETLRRYRIIVGLAVAVMVPTALVLAVILTPPSRFGGIYGVLAVCSALLLAFFGLVAWRPQRLGVVAGIGVLWLAMSVAMAIQPAPAFGHRSFTAQEVFLGFNVPDPPNALRMLTMWRFDIVLGSAAIVLAVLYLLGAYRLHKRGDEWTRWRTAAWVSGCVGLLIVTSSGVGTYGYAMFSVHMAIHMALNMFIPVLLVLGAPVTLLLRAVEPAGRNHLPGPREWVQSLMHSKFTVLLSNAMIALAVFVVSLYGLYFTSLFDQLIRFHWGHLLMNIHFLLTGYLFYWAIIGVDPGPKKLPHLGRLGMLFAVMPFHAFFGVAVMSMDTMIGGKFYPELGLTWMHNLMADQHVGGGMAWISGEVPVLLVVGALLSQWAKQDRKDNKRTERHQDVYPEDDELAAYNAMLAQLGRNRR